MKRLIVLSTLFSVSLLAIWLVFDPLGAALPERQNNNLPVEIQNEEMPKSNEPADLETPAILEDVKIAPVFDASGLVVSDPTGTIWIAKQSGDAAALVVLGDVRIAPVFDATGAVVSDPTGTMSNTITK